MTTDHDLLTMADELGINITVQQKDQFLAAWLACKGIPYGQEDSYHVINMQSSQDGNGTHWVALSPNVRGTWFYFDSFGFPPPVEVEKALLVEEEKPTIVYSRSAIQDPRTGGCGQYCLAWIRELSLTKPKKNVNALTKAYRRYLGQFN